MAAPTNIRQINRREILEVLLRHGMATRSELARATGLSQPTAGKIVDELLSDGVLRSEAPALSASRMGRPGHGLVLNDQTPCYLAIQLGIHRTRLARLAAVPPLVDTWDHTIPTPRSMKAWLRAILAPAKKLLSPTMKAVLISVPGIFDDTAGRSLLSPNLPWLESQAFVESVQRCFDLPVFGVQELRCLALGHCVTHPAADSFLLVDFGNGVGSAPVLHRRLVQGELPMGGELGHTPVPGNTRDCGCGGVGCLETLIRRDAVLESLNIRGDDWHAEWTKAAQQLSAGTLPQPFRYALEATGLVIAGALNVLGLNHVIATGYIGELSPSVLRILTDRIQQAAVAGRFGVVQTTFAPRQRLAGLASIGIERVIAPA